MTLNVAELVLVPAYFLCLRVFSSLEIVKTKSPEQQVICMAAEVVSQTPEAFMLAATLAEAERVLQHELSSLQQSGDNEAASRLENALTAVRSEQQAHELTEVSVLS